MQGCVCGGGEWWVGGQGAVVWLVEGAEEEEAEKAKASGIQVGSQVRVWGGILEPVCPRAQGMIALRRGATELTHEDYMEGILEVQAKKKANLQYYA